MANPMQPLIEGLCGTHMAINLEGLGIYQSKARASLHRVTLALDKPVYTSTFVCRLKKLTVFEWSLAQGHAAGCFFDVIRTVTNGVAGATY